MKTEKKYPSEITREQFEEIRTILESAKKRTKPREINLFEIFNAVLYLLKTGCQWRQLPSDYPNWKTVHRYFTIWRTAQNEKGETVLNQALKKMVGFTALSIVIVMAGLGVGAWNEIVEFFVAEIISASGVGGYLNTSLDLVADLIGAILGLLYIRWRYLKG